MRIGLFILVIILGIAVPKSSYPQDNSKKQEMSVRGTIVDVDWVAGKILVRYYDQYAAADELTFIVTSDTKIYKGTDTIALDDINMSDRVTVEYYNDSFAGLKAISITVKQ